MSNLAHKAATQTKRISRVHVLYIPDESPDTSYLEQDEFEDRLEQFQNGLFNFVGIRASAEIVVEGVCQTITSGGLWGIESDSGPAYFAEIAQEELSELRTQLHAIGFSKRAISAAFKNVEEGR